MAIDITALYCCLDDFCKVFEASGKASAGRDNEYSIAEPHRLTPVTVCPDGSVTSVSA